MNKYYLIIFSLIVIFSGCSNKENAIDTETIQKKNSNPPIVEKDVSDTNEILNHKDEQEQKDENEENASNTEGSNQETNQLTSKEAEEKVRAYLQISKDTDVIVEFDHKVENRYVIHVYDLIDEGQKTEHTATRGWYYVDIATGEIESMF